MISKNISRRLERLEERLLPSNEEPVVIVVQGVDTDGQVVQSFQLTVPAYPRLVKQR
jgi:hypothetical protein